MSPWIRFACTQPGECLSCTLMAAVNERKRILWAFDIIAQDPVPGSASPKERFGAPSTFSYNLVPRSNHVSAIIMEDAHIAEREARVWEL